ncbi:MAG: hypothetical protein H8E63_08745 [Proteobacteria bacterium]|nr:hypothetical protein [Pseudomonadota bacterium]
MSPRSGSSCAVQLLVMDEARPESSVIEYGATSRLVFESMKSIALDGVALLHRSRCTDHYASGSDVSA